MFPVFLSVLFGVLVVAVVVLASVCSSQHRLNSEAIDTARRAIDLNDEILARNRELLRGNQELLGKLAAAVQESRVWKRKYEAMAERFGEVEG